VSPTTRTSYGATPTSQVLDAIPVSNWISIDDMRLAEQYKWMKPKIPMWRHVQVDGDFGNGGRLRDKIEECINKLNK
jgi:hypothetical protein